MGDDERPGPDAELRLAVAFTGGLSLAVWMGGVARELNLLTTAARAEKADTHAGRVRARYKKLLELLRLDVSVDVLSGTSAGGINAAVLGLANVRGCDLGGLRALWLEEGALGSLLRDLSEQKPPSLLKGEDGLLRGLEEGLKAVLAAPVPGLEGGVLAGDADPDPTHVFITTTLLDGLPRPFRDDYGSVIRDTDHRGLFRFTADDLADDHVIKALARAARSSASYPVAFEPAYIPVGEPTHERPDMSPYMLRLSRTQFCADGGLLANRPIGPALQAVFDRPASREVRRVLAYVVPSPDGEAGDPPPLPLPADVPSLGPTLLKVFRVVTSQTVTAELSALAAHNERVRSRLRAETRLARMAAGGADLGGADLRREHYEAHVQALARAVADETLAQLIARGAASGDRPVGFGADMDRLIAGAAAVIERHGPPPETLLEGAEVFAALARYGRPLLDAAKSTVLRLLRESSAGAPVRTRTGVEARVAEVHRAMPHRTDLKLRKLLRPVVEAVVAGATENTDPVDAVLQAPGWAPAVAAQLPSPDQLPDLERAWSTMVDAVLGTRPLLLGAEGGTGGGDAEWRVLLTYLTGPDPDDPLPADAVARRLYDLLAAQRVIFPDELAARQRVELIQMSADTRALVDTRRLAAEKLTGLQTHHFGAFFKRSWRANDWMWGRLDGAGWLVHVLLSPKRLQRLAAGGVPVVQGLRDIAGSGEPAGVFTTGPDGEPAELAFLTADDGTEPPDSLPLTSMWVARGLQRLIVAEELPHVAAQAELDKQAGGALAASDFLKLYRQRHPDIGRTGQNPGQAVDPETVEDLLKACRISEETFTKEKDSKLLSHTVAHSAVVTANAVRAAVDRWYWRLLFGTVSGTLRLAHAFRRRPRSARTPH
ncbi:patatin-like protein [Streptomyces capitiformicae]|uniref:Membrane protein n=1 Tax=Streptomyces capitiformicae TaxID=2014920 RepID=A0A919GP36_9ACTN|nr:patatin-like protein [Streptomyces capitiformicae]GHH88178.1 putative membrane protein [Streptomyces capitiformicae]